MTMPRRVVPGAVLLITRRTLRREFRLRPSKETNQLFGYLLAVLSERYGIRVHGFTLMSNHFHLVITDTQGSVPAFMRDLCAFMARALNARQGRWETFWAPGSFSAVTLVSKEDALDKLAYVVANPAIASLVAHGCEWIGLHSSPEQIGGEPVVFERPARFFRKVGRWPSSAAISILPLAGYASVQEFRDLLAARVRAREDAAARARAEQGADVLGAFEAERQPVDGGPRGRESRRGLNPRIAAKDKWKRIDAIGQLKRFLFEYRVALRRFAAGKRDELFPYGTYWMRVMHNVACATG